MTPDDIIYDWVQKNHNQLPTVTCSEEVIKFITETHAPILIKGEDKLIKERVYCVNNFYQKIKLDEANEQSKIKS